GREIIRQIRPQTICETTAAISATELAPAKAGGKALASHSTGRPGGYNRRSTMERINARLDRSFNFETHYIRGRARMKTRVGLALAVMTALALSHARASRAGRMRSLVDAVPYRDTG
ncbi:MAG: hypothetical protein OXT64_00005, partial [Gammaproteobacteria bacterium]|nr:hypothetical protein [Gammaproteobacteria bacterium]